MRGRCCSAQPMCVDDQVNVRNRGPVARRIPAKTELFVEPVRRSIGPGGRQGQATKAKFPAAVEAGFDKSTTHAPTLNFRIDGEHTELALVVAGDLAPRTACRTERHRPEHASTFVDRDEEFCLRGAARGIAQMGHVATTGHSGGLISGHRDGTHYGVLVRMSRPNGGLEFRRTHCASVSAGLSVIVTQPSGSTPLLIDILPPV